MIDKETGNLQKASVELKQDSSLPRRSFLKLLKAAAELYFYGKILPINWQESSRKLLEKSTQLLSQEYLESLARGCLKTWDQIAKLELPGAKTWINKTVPGSFSRTFDQTLLLLKPMIVEDRTTDRFHALPKINQQIRDWQGKVKNDDGFRIQSFASPKTIKMVGGLRSLPDSDGFNRLMHVNEEERERLALTLPLQAGLSEISPISAWISHDGDSQPQPQVLVVGSAEDIFKQRASVLGRLNLITGEFFTDKEPIRGIDDVKCFPLADAALDGDPFSCVLLGTKLFLAKSEHKALWKIDLLSDRRVFYEIIDGKKVEPIKVMISNPSNISGLREVAIEFVIKDENNIQRKLVSLYQFGLHSGAENREFANDYISVTKLDSWEDDFVNEVDRVILNSVGSKVVVGKIHENKLIAYQILIEGRSLEVELSDPIPYDQDTQIKVFCDYITNQLFLVDLDNQVVPNSESNFTEPLTPSDIFQSFSKDPNLPEFSLPAEISETLPPKSFNGEQTLSLFDLEATRIFGFWSEDLQWKFESHESKHEKSIVVGEETAIFYLSGLGLDLQFSSPDKTDLINYLNETFDQCLNNFLEKKYGSKEYAKLAFEQFTNDVLSCVNYSELLATMKNHQLYFLPWIIAAQPNPLTDVEKMVLGKSQEDWDLDVVDSRDGGSPKLFLAGIEEFSSVNIPSTSLALQTLRIIADHKPKSAVFFGHSGGANALNSLLKIVQEGWADNLLGETKINGAIISGRISLPEEFYEHVAFILSLIQSPKVVNKVQELLGLVGFETTADLAIGRSNLSYVVPKDFVAGINPNKIRHKCGTVVDIVNQFDPEQVNQIMIEEILSYAKEVSAPYIEQYLLEHLRDLDANILDKIGQFVQVNLSSNLLLSEQVNLVVDGFWQYLFTVAKKAAYTPYPTNCVLSINDQALADSFKWTKRYMYRNFLANGSFNEEGQHLITWAHIQLQSKVIRASLGFEN